MGKIRGLALQVRWGSISDDLAAVTSSSGICMGIVGGSGVEEEDENKVEEREGGKGDRYDRVAKALAKA